MAVETQFIISLITYNIVFSIVAKIILNTEESENQEPNCRSVRELYKNEKVLKRCGTAQEETNFRKGVAIFHRRSSLDVDDLGRVIYGSNNNPSRKSKHAPFSR